MELKPFIDYLTLEKKYSVHTVTAYKRDVSDFFDFSKETFEISSLAEVHYPMVRSWIVVLVDSGISNRTVNRKISSLKTFYRFLLKVGAVTETPLAKHRALKTAKKIQIPFSEAEISDVLALLKDADDFEGMRNKLIVELFYSTGMRRAELINLQLSDISEVKKTIKVLGKRNKERIIPLLPSIIKTLKEYMVFRKEVDVNNSLFLVLTSKGVKVYEGLIYRVITSYFEVASAKIKKSPHILRHSFATHLLNEGAALTAVKELLGHASLASTQVYTHNNITTLKEVYRVAHPRNSK